MAEDDSRGALQLYLYRENCPTKKLDRVKELLTDKFSYLKNNKRQTVYIVATIGSGIACYALTGIPEAGLGIAIASACISVAHDSYVSFNQSL